MPDVFTETTSQGFFSRLGGSFAGLLIGPLLVIGAIILLSWNEGRAVQAIVGLKSAQSQTIEAAADQVAPANEGKLVHVVGPAAASQPIADSDLGIDFSNQVAVSRTVEMYQWREKSESSKKDELGGGQTTTTTYTYTMAWSASPQDSSSFHHPDGHANPEMPFRSQNYVAADAKLGGYALDSGTLGQIELTQPLAPEPPSGWTSSGGQLNKGDPAAPKVGDLRVRYTGLASGATISVLAAQSHGGFAPFVTANGYSVHLAEPGNVTTAAMIANKRHAESMLTWILRGVGAFVIFLGFALFFGPISTFASVVPFLGGLARGAVGFLAFVLAVPVTLIVIAIAWISFRPVVGGGLLVAALLAAILLWRWHAARRPAAKPA